MKNKYFISTTIILLIVISGFRIVEDPNFLQRLKDSLQEYNNSYPEEKVYLQFDKPFYKPGEDIWFNAFVLNSNTHKPTITSDVIYVELIDPKGNVASRLELVIKEGTANGDFSLLDTAPGGLYQVRAFTQWMKNFGKENFFNKEIQVQRIITPRLLLKLNYEKESYGPGDQVKADLTITNLKNEPVNHAAIRFIVTIRGSKLLESNIVSDSKGKAAISFQLPDSLTTTDGLLQCIITTQGVEESISRSIPIVLNKITLQFYPEGGNLVAGTGARIAMKALNEFGKGADVSGYIVDEDNTRVAAFESFHMGMGAFNIKPLRGKKYFAKINTPSGNELLIPLPLPVEAGYSLQLKGLKDSAVNWKIHSPVSGDVHLVGQTHGEMVYSSKIKLNAGENSVEIQTEKFPAGIAVFTLFDAQGLEQCERLVFLHAEKGLNIQLMTDKEYYSPREKVELKIQTTDHQGKPIPAKLSLAVADDQLLSFADDKQDNILSSLLLSSEVRGEIQEPSFYFDPNEPKATEALDYLLMTQGWRRFAWKDITEMKKLIAFTPEKVKNIAGRIVNKGKGLATEITLLELGNKKRIDKIKTTANGHFIFKNVDPTVPVILMVKKPGEIDIQKEETFSIHLNDKEGTVLLPATIEESVAATIIPKEETKAEELGTESDVNISLDEDVSQLSEVVVTGFGVENKSGFMASVVTVYESSWDSKLPSPAFENVLQGRVAGLLVQPQSGNPGSNSKVRIRGISSLAGRGEPLYVIDGHPIGSSLNQNFSNGSIIGPEDIQSIEVMNSPEATAIFGSAAANGVILITTRSRIGYSNFKSKRKLGRYIGHTIYPRKFSATREFYVQPPSAGKTEKREDFRSTQYWNHTIVTNERGEAKLSFYNSDAVSAFRIIAEGFSGSGLIGREEEVYFTQLPFSLDAKLPEFLGFEDTLRLPVHVKNETLSTLSGKITIILPGGLTVQELATKKVEVKAQSSEIFWFTISSKGIEGEFPISINLESPHYQDKIEHVIRVQPIGFPVTLSFSSRELDKTVLFAINNAEQGTMKAELTAFPDVLSDLFTGAESILREPHGCFEQVSASTFPNILALQFLKQSGLIRPDVEKRALTYIQNGYKQLMAYEISGGGFEWFGHPPAHEGLTAYGLVEFHEMKKVYDKVDEKMVDRTRNWLLSRRLGNGKFKQNAGKYGFSAASEAVTNAYITYALSETGTKEILPEYQLALTEALQSKDMYRMALIAIASYNLGKVEDYNTLVKIFKETIDVSGFDRIKAEHSIVRSYGNSLTIETVSLWTMALLKSAEVDRTLVSECIQQIIKSRQYGQFGSTQGTTMALKALTEYAKLARAKRDDGEIQIFVNNKIAEKHYYEKEVREKLVLNDFVKNLNSNGEQTLRIVFNETPEPLPYSVNIQWHTKKPQSNDECKVSLTTSLNASSVRLNETVRLTALVKNRTSEGVPMTTAVIGIPAGLNAQPWQLKELQEKQIFDFYEIKGGNLILYYRELGPSATQTINLDLKAEIPGTFTGAASAVYLYYTNEHKTWVKGNSILIN